MNNLVTGGTGLLGSTLLYQLIEKGESIVALKRENTNPDKVRRVFELYNPKSGAELFDKIEWLNTDIQNFSSLEFFYEKKIDQVYHLAATVSFAAQHKEKLSRTNHWATEQLVNLSLEAGVKKFCYISSVATLNKPNDDRCLDESSDFDSQIASDYAITKHKGEKEVWRASFEGMPVIVIKPSVILASGFWGKSSGTVFDQAMKLPFAPDGKMGIIDVRDLAYCIHFLMESEIKNESFVLNAHNISYLEFSNEIRKRLGKSPARLVSSRLLKTAGFFSHIMGYLNPRYNTLPPMMTKAMLNKNIYDNSKVRKFVDFSFLSLNETMDFHVQNFSKDRGAI